MERYLTFNSHRFEYCEEMNSYESRGDTYYDDYHDQVPEPSLRIAADRLQDYLNKQGIDCEVEYGEKGWVEVIMDIN